MSLVAVTYAVLTMLCALTYRVIARRTFGRFLGLDDGDAVPDETTIWRFREAPWRWLAQ